MILVALEEAAQKGELLIVDGGMCRFHVLRDGSVTIRELIVLPERRRQGIGRRLVQEVIRRAGKGMVRAKCPVEYEANRFWLDLGFTNMGDTDGVRLWNWYGARTVISSTPDLPFPVDGATASASPPEAC